MKFLTVEPSPLPIRISLGPRYSYQDPVFKYPWPAFLPYVRDQASQPCSTTGNIIVLYIVIFKFIERSREDKSVWTV